jgi:hypothetical protein
MGWKSRTEKAKKDHRPNLKDWAGDDFHKTFPEFSKRIQNLENMGYQHFNAKGGDQYHSCHSTIPARLDAKYTSPKQFHDNYEAKGIPCVFTNIPQGYDLPLPPQRKSSFEEKKDCNDYPERTPHAWPALDRWTLNNLQNDSDLRERLLRCGECDDGHSIRIKLKLFMKYQHKNNDDSPLYIFEGAIDEDRFA